MTADTAGAEPAREWYADGLAFECTQCGNCCTGPPGAVWVTDEEIAAIAAHVGVEDATFRRRHARRVGRRWSLAERRTEHGHDCIFLDRSTPGRATCSIYPVRPAQCRTWPFWPENLETPEDWARVKRETPCPGMGRGAIVPIEAIRVRRDETP